MAVQPAAVCVGTTTQAMRLKERLGSIKDLLSGSETDPDTVALRMCVSDSHPLSTLSRMDQSTECLVWCGIGEDARVDADEAHATINVRSLEQLEHLRLVVVCMR